MLDNKIYELFKNKCTIMHVLDSMPFMVWVKDHKGSYLCVNSRFEITCGKNSKEIIGKVDFDIWPERDALKYRESDERVMKSCSSNSIDERFNDIKNGYCLLNVFKTTILDQHGKAIGIVGIATKRKEEKQFWVRLYKQSRFLKPIIVERNMKVKFENEKIIETKKTEILRINCFGKFEVFKDKKKIRWRGSKTKELFAFLLKNRLRSIHKDEIIDMFWNRYDYPRAKANMQAAICRIRKSFDELGNYITIDYSCNSYSIDIENVYLDVYEFEKLTKGICKVDITNIESAVKALKLYKGEYMEEDGFIWALSKQASINNRYDEILHEVVKYYLDSNKHNEVLRLLNEIVYINSLNKTANDILNKIQKNYKCNNM